MELVEWCRIRCHESAQEVISVPLLAQLGPRAQRANFVNPIIDTGQLSVKQMSILLNRTNGNTISYFMLKNWSACEISRPRKSVISKK